MIKIMFRCLSKLSDPEYMDFMDNLTNAIKFIDKEWLSINDIIDAFNKITVDIVVSGHDCDIPVFDSTNYVFRKQDLIKSSFAFNYKPDKNAKSNAGTLIVEIMTQPIKRSEVSKEIKEKKVINVTIYTKTGNTYNDTCTGNYPICCSNEEIYKDLNRATRGIFNDSVCIGFDNGMYCCSSIECITFNINKKGGY